jgi:hypothetical protein
VCIWSRRLSLAACLLWIFVATNLYFEEEEAAAAAAARNNILSASSSVWRDQLREERKIKNGGNRIGLVRSSLSHQLHLVPHLGSSCRMGTQ